MPANLSHLVGRDICMEGKDTTVRSNGGEVSQEELEFRTLLCTAINHLVLSLMLISYGCL